MQDNYRHPVDEKKVKFKPNLLGSGGNNKKWSLIITLVSFFLSASMSVIASNILGNVGILVSFFVVFAIIVINILFDIIGTAVTAADEAPFHAMASRKVYGAKQAIKLIRNADKVSNFCNDVIGDICGVISGTASTYIVLRIAADSESLRGVVINLIMTGMVASFTVGGKAFGKSLAIENSNYIIYKVSIIINFFKLKIKWKRDNKNKRKRK
ncbi:Mg2+ and Co2+ transporter CorB [Clostridium thermosuccinogenes]|uniref:Mg2+ and Co2+ transporter CorB n=1 Tax=Clostridium thermosuccinogenes TaxID=84032 RepID=A0A2K2FJ10_9CLOT|nr:Mg2+ and Co2+ transporter CorB [Pseudoclostridium thermosuccinogenes]AUS96173.1 Mg2+ and Co2+ transporter CorB [Pseudoclostridium thermosuccinogenes]PNT98753.1 Mg2+ and Co2+ transporter CorB [Pseudoclostridium thermosuccinogenes]PNU00752.1 Mg2+ and Co2+ transporter CorB [Pseudoclostridium thermosuccinogenes]